MIPKSIDIGYNDAKTDERILGLLSVDGETIVVPFDSLLKFHLPDLHYELDRDSNEALGKLKPCPSDCNTKEMCGVMQKSLLIGDYIRIKLREKNALFRFIAVPFPVGSLKEATRLFDFGIN